MPFSEYPLAKFLRLTRVAADMTQTELANRVGCGQNSLSDWECGNSLPPLWYLPALAEALGLPLPEFAAKAALAAAEREPQLNRSRSNGRRGPKQEN